MKIHIYLFTVLIALCLPEGFSQAAQPKQSPDNPKAANGRGDTIKAAIIDRPEPKIPSECPEGESKARVRMLLTEKGKVSGIELVEKSACSTFDKNAMKAARKIKFTPARKDGVAVSVSVTIDYSYKKFSSYR